MQRGELVGGPHCLGYDFDWETRQITVNQEEAKIVRYIFDRYLEGIGGRVIARELEEMGVTSPRGNKSWDETTILGVIKNEKYKGDVLQSFRLLYQNNDKIIDLFLQTIEEEISDNSLEVELQSIEKEVNKAEAARKRYHPNET
ncbi:recombinase family protein [Streptococcus macedonicus]|nr:recombinase family protein [Streptococcus macedonicus]MCW8519915.1 recombinase family protein [Streptococcus macedonicus]MCW8521650.1 recombinase family protein [Streptococcus macedonicus]